MPSSRVRLLQTSPEVPVSAASLIARPSKRGRKSASWTVAIKIWTKTSWCSLASRVCWTRSIASQAPLHLSTRLIMFIRRIRRPTRMKRVRASLNKLNSSAAGIVSITRRICGRCSGWLSREVSCQWKAKEMQFRSRTSTITARTRTKNYLLRSWCATSRLNTIIRYKYPTIAVSIIWKIYRMQITASITAT